MPHRCCYYLLYIDAEHFSSPLFRRIIFSRRRIVRSGGPVAYQPVPNNFAKLRYHCRSISEKQATKPIVTVRDDGLYDILSRTTLLDEDLPEAAIVKCSLSIPRANYNVSRKTIYYAG